MTTRQRWLMLGAAGRALLCTVCLGALGLVASARASPTRTAQNAPESRPHFSIRSQPDRAGRRLTRNVPRLLPGARGVGLDDTSGLSRAYIYLRDLGNPPYLYRKPKWGHGLQVQRAISWRRYESAAALDPTGRWIVEVAGFDSFIRKHNALTGEYADYNTHLPAAWANVACDSEYVYEQIDFYVYRFRLSDLSFVDSTKIDQQALHSYLCSFANDSIWVGDRESQGFHVYPASGMGNDSAHAARFQAVGTGFSNYASPTWDGHYYYVEMIYPGSDSKLRRYSQDWSSYDEQYLEPNIYCPMVVSKPDANDVGTIELRSPSEVIPVGRPAEIRALIGNFGSATQGPFDVVMDFGNRRFTKTVALLAAGDTTEVSSGPFTPDSSGLFIVECSTALAGDEDTTDDVVIDSAGTVVADYFEAFEATNGGFAAVPPNEWAWGAPGAHRPPAFSGNYVWGDRLEGRYDSSGNQRLISPGYTAFIDTPMVVFCQWYNFNGDDGGNCSYSTDYGDTWQLLHPWTTWPYDGYVAGLGEEGWSFPYADTPLWQRAIMKVPVTDLRINNGTAAPI